MELPAGHTVMLEDDVRESRASKHSTASCPFFHNFLAASDLLSHTFTFLSFTDLLTTSSISQLIHTAADSDKVWRPRLTAALAISALPIASTAAVDTPPVAPHQPDAAPPSILAVLSVLHRYVEVTSGRHVGPAPRHYRWPTATKEALPEVCAIVPTERSMVYHVKWVTAHSGAQCHVECREVEIERTEAGRVQGGDELKQSQGEEAATGEREWEVKRVGPPNSGRLVLNMADNRHLLTAPTPLPTPPQSAKQRYLASFGCSVRHSACSSAKRSGVCRTLLPPQPPLPAPAVPPHWFSEHLRDAVANGVEPPPLPTTPYPALAVWPVCSACRAEVAVAVQAVCDGWRRVLRQRPQQVDCLVRVNETEWDCRSREFEDDMQYRRVAIAHTASAEPSTSSSSSASAAAQVCFKPARLFQDDSGQYAISHPSNLPFDNPAPPSGPPRTHPNHEHPLRYYRVSPYRHGGYVCNECADNANGEVWHCERCQFDLCMECAAEWPVPDGEERHEERERGEVEGEDDGPEQDDEEEDVREEMEADGWVGDEEGEEEEQQHDLALGAWEMSDADEVNYTGQD
ncbi:hypothetical protein MMC34_008448 [Xylographa carneopallida]|nr:hypothetical protein [Xylographa carneopallida]